MKNKIKNYYKKRPIELIKLIQYEIRKKIETLRKMIQIKEDKTNPKRPILEFYIDRAKNKKLVKLFLERVGEEYRIIYFSVDGFESSNLKGLGIGKILLEEVIKHARGNGIKKITLIATKERANFYIRLGFIPRDKLVYGNNIRFDTTLD